MEPLKAIALAANVVQVIEFSFQLVRITKSYRLATRDQSNRLKNMQVELKRYQDGISTLGQESDVQQLYTEAEKLLRTVTRYLGSNTERRNFWGVVRRSVDMAPIIRKRREKEVNLALTMLRTLASKLSSVL